MKLLFVCLGNICRSPAAEGIMNHLVAQAGLEGQVICESAGTSSHHAGELPDRRMRSHAEKRGYTLDSLSRPFELADFRTFDYIFAMDTSNFKNITSFNPPDHLRNKVFLVTSFCRHHKHHGVPDPYSSDSEGFQLVLDILEDACQHIFEKLIQPQAQP